MMKTCKQCGRLLPEESFKQYPSRGRGVYQTTQGRHTICLECESISRRAAYAMKKGDEEVIEMLRNHYQMLQDRGYPPATAAAKDLMGVKNGYTPKRRGKEALSDLLASVGQSPTVDFVAKLERREFENADKAYEAHKPLITSLREEGKLEYVTALIEAWYDEEDQES